MMHDVCCLLEERWRGHGAWMLGMNGRRYKLWWSEKGDGVMVKVELCEKVVDVRRVSDRLMSVVVVDVLRLICVYSPLSGRSLEEKQSSMTN